MIFNLINTKSYYSKIEEYVFDDIGMKTLFDDFYDHNWSDLQSVMEYVKDNDEVLKRQAIFTDFLNDNEMGLNTFKRLLDEVIGSFKNYKTTDGGLKSYILYTQYIDKLVTFFKEGMEVLNKLDLGSKELNNIKKFLNDKNNDKDFLELCDLNSKAINAYKEMEGMVVSYITGDTFIKTNKMSEQVLLDDYLKSILRRLDINTNDELVNNIRHELDPYYFNRLEYIYPDQYEILKDFFDKYKDEINYDYFTLSDELNYYLKLKLLFIHAKEKGVPYTKASIGEETHIEGLCDYTIMNKVEFIQGNDFHLTDKNHMLIVTGTNGGGKTTYLRSIGANYILFNACGYTFSDKCLIKPVKYIHTHFPNDENYQVGYGRLQDELKRIDYVRGDFCTDCLYLLNETFSSTDEDRAFNESKKLLKDIEDTNTSMIFITHQQTLLRYIDREKIILLNPIVDTDNNNKRLFKIRRVENEVHAFANDILRKYGLSKDMLLKAKEERLKNKSEGGIN